MDASVSINRWFIDTYTHMHIIIFYRDHFCVIAEIWFEEPISLFFLNKELYAKEKKKKQKLWKVFW